MVIRVIMGKTTNGEIFALQICLLLTTYTVKGTIDSDSKELKFEVVSIPSSMSQCYCFS